MQLYVNIFTFEIVSMQDRKTYFQIIMFVIIKSKWEGRDFGIDI